jgi:recombination protein RecT
MSNTDVATTAVNKPPLVVLRERLESRRDELKKALPSDISPDRFIRAIITSTQINPDLLACNFQSLWIACLRACRDGLLPDGREGAIVPFKSTATWIPMYQGLLKRFRRSGQFRWTKADVVREGEEFYHYVDEHGEHIRHTPGDSIEAPIIKIYAMATTKDGGVFVTVMPVAEIEKIRAMSKATREDAPWRMWYSEMAKKTALRRLSKVLPSEGDLPDDDLPEYDAAPAIAMTSPTPDEPPRAKGAAAALDAFASSADQVTRPAEPVDGGGDGEDATTSPPSAAESASKTTKPDKAKGAT